MADDQDKEPTSGSHLPSADGPGQSADGSPGPLPIDGAMHQSDSDDAAAADDPVELDARLDDSATFGSDPVDDESGGDGDPRDFDASDAVPEELREDPDADPTDDRELVSVGAPVGTVSAGNHGSGSTRGRIKKDEATLRQGREVESERRTGPLTFVKQSVGELRKVVYPTSQQLAQYFVVVLVFVLFIIGIVSLLDLGFGWMIFKIFS